jgi:hypothetical protein
MTTEDVKKRYIELIREVFNKITQIIIQSRIVFESDSKLTKNDGVRTTIEIEKENLFELDSYHLVFFFLV